MTHKLLTALILVASMVLTESCKQFLPGKNTDGTVKFIVGTVTLNGKQTAIGDTIRFGDIIETGVQSSCDLLIGGKNILSLAPDTRLLYRITTRESNLELFKGGFGALLRNREATGDVNIKTPTVTASIRGTAFYLAVENREKTYACVCNGTIHFRPETGFFSKPAGKAGGKVVSASHHTAYYYTGEKGAVRIDRAGLKYHSDEAMNRVAAVIGETIDWTKIE